jgi:hypothetical protein
MVCVATVLSVAVVNLARNHHATPLPWLLKKLLTGWLGQVLCLGHITDQVLAARNDALLSACQEATSDSDIYFLSLCPITAAPAGRNSRALKAFHVHELRSAYCSLPDGSVSCFKHFVICDNIKSNVRLQTALIWPSALVHMAMRFEAERKDVSWAAERLLVSEQGLSSVELVYCRRPRRS